MLRFTVLGTTGFEVDGEPVKIGGRRARAVLACLCAHADTVVSNDRILEEAWGGAPPASGINALRVQINQLRSVLGDHADVLITDPPGYRLAIPAGGLDAARYVAAVALADQLASSSPDRASGLLDEAESLWVGAPYSDVGDLAFADDERRRLTATRSLGLAVRLDVENALGRHDRVLQTVAEALAEEPYDERLWRAKMLAAYLAGNQQLALSTFQDLRTSLADIGLDPSAESSELELRILQQDPDLVRGERGTNAPTPVSALVGRESEVDTVLEALTEQRLVTLIGFGGVGKTRLAIEVANRAEVASGGVWFVDLTAVRPGEVVAAAIASAVGLYTPSRDAAWESLEGWVADADRLLVLDNCEQIAGDVAEVVSRLTAISEAVRVLATSRIRLGVSGERVIHLSPLPTVGTVDDPSEASRLLQLRAADAGVDLADEDAGGNAKRLTDMLEGHPLAIELAAAQLRYRSIADLADRLDSALVDQLADPARSGDRHGALSSVLTASWQLMSPQAQDAVARLALFRGGFTREAAIYALGDSTDTQAILAELVDASLVEVIRGGPALRYRALETVRQFARDTLDDEARTEAMRRHVQIFRRLATERSEELFGVGQVHARSALDAESANLRAAIDHARSLGDRDAELEIAASAGVFWFETGRHVTGRNVLRRTIADDLANADPHAANEVLRAAAELFAWGGHVDEAYAAAAMEMDLARGDAEVVADALGTHGVISFITGRYDDAAASMTSLVEVSTEHGLGPRPYALASAAYLELLMGHPESAQRHIEDAIDHAGELGEVATSAMLDDYRGWRSFQAGELDEAGQRWRGAEEAYLELGMVPMAADVRQLQAWVAIETGDPLSVSMLASAQEDLRNASLRPYVIRGEILEAAATAIADPASSLRQLEATLLRAAATSTRLNLVWGLIYASRCAEALGLGSAADACRKSAAELAARVPLALPAWLERAPASHEPDRAMDDAAVMRRALAKL